MQNVWTLPARQLNSMSEKVDRKCTCAARFLAGLLATCSLSVLQTTAAKTERIHPSADLHDRSLRLQLQNLFANELHVQADGPVEPCNAWGSGYLGPLLGDFDVGPQSLGHRLKQCHVHCMQRRSVLQFQSVRLYSKSAYHGTPLAGVQAFCCRRSCSSKSVDVGSLVWDHMDLCCSMLLPSSSVLCTPLTTESCCVR